MAETTGSVTREERGEYPWNFPPVIAFPDPTK